MTHPVFDVSRNVYPDQLCCFVCDSKGLIWTTNKRTHEGLNVICKQCGLNAKFNDDRWKRNWM